LGTLTCGSATLWNHCGTTVEFMWNGQGDGWGKGAEKSYLPFQMKNRFFKK